MNNNQIETVYKLTNTVLWVINRDGFIGIGQNKKEATEQFGKNYANRGIPSFINELGSCSKQNNLPRVNSVPGALSFIQSLIPLESYCDFFFRVIIDQGSSKTFVEICEAGEPEIKPLRYWSDDPKGFHAQVRNCIYEWYVETEQGGDVKYQHPKLAEWQKNWYYKLQPKAIP